MEIKPHRGVGPFRIGSFLGETIKFLQLHGMSFRSNTITTRIENPLLNDVCLDMRSFGIRLRFDSRSQRLHLIDIYDLEKVVLVYDSKYITHKAGEVKKANSATAATSSSTTSSLPTFRWIYDVFGPTYPGSYHKEKQVYMLQYPGVCILFPMSQATMAAQGSIFPLELPDGHSPPASRIFLHHGTSVQNLSLRSLAGGLEPTCVFINQGFLLPKRNVFVGFDSSVQACLSDLGPPQQVFVKRENQMKIHSSTSDEDKQAPAKDYFFNYLLLGIDLLFDGRVHRVKSIVFHTNSCASRQFTHYRKCNFRIFLNDSLETSQLKATVANEEKGGRSLQDGIEQAKAQHTEGIFQTIRRSQEEIKDRHQKRTRKPSDNETVETVTPPSVVNEADDEDDEFKTWGKGPVVGPDTHWDTIKSLKGECGRPMLHNKGDNTPFGSTQFFAYAGIIFEVMSNKYLDTVTLFVEDAPTI